MDRVAIFVDVQNIYYTFKEVHGGNFDYTRFWKETTSKRKVVKAFAYAIDRGDEKQRRFQKALGFIGFEVVLKPYIFRKDGSSKGDWDVGIVLDMVEYAPDADVIVLASGDGDFQIAVERVREKFGVKVEIYGVPKLTANGLIQSADRFVAITDRYLMS